MDRDSYFSSALFSTLCHCFGFDDIPVSDRFDPSSHLDSFNGDGDYWAKRALLCSLFKKSEVEADPSAEAATLLSFLEANHACKEWEIDSLAGPAVGYSIDYARDILAQWFEPQCGTDLAVTMATIEMEARFGPGQSVGHTRNKPTQYYFKVGDSAMAATSEFVRSWYDLSIQHNPLCEAAEMARKARHGPIELVECGNLSMVPKSYSSRRVIVTEPSANTFFQLGLGGVISNVLVRHTGIDLSTQQFINAEMAKIGSRNGQFATVDLKQCSDYIALGLVKALFPKSVTNWVLKLRTPKVKIDGIGEIDLSMASTMGNGFTFPLQTALLCALVLGVYKTLDMPIIRANQCEKGIGTFGVYGDDIVVLNEAYDLFVKVLLALKLVPNAAKSYATGSFRESCGHDYYNGRDIRGVYVKKYRTLQDFFSIFNRLAIWSAKQAIDIHPALMLVSGQIRDFCLIPPDENIDGGIFMPVAPGPEGSDYLWRYHLYVPKPSALHFELWERWRYGVEGDEPLRLGRRVKKWLSELLQKSGGSINEPAALKTLLFGGIRRDKIVYRTERTVPYRKVEKVTPRWGFSSNPLVLAMGPLEVERWMRSVLRVIEDSRIPE